MDGTYGLPSLDGSLPFTDEYPQHFVAKVSPLQAQAGHRYPLGIRELNRTIEAQVSRIAAELSLPRQELTLLAAVAFGEYTYPQCSENGKGCCEFGTGSMRNRGYVIIALEGDDMVVTCSNGVLRCSYENPNKKASYEAAANVTCPDFTSMMESRSEITYLEGVKATTSTTATDESAAGTVKAAEISD